MRWDTNICDSKHSILWHLWQPSKKSQYAHPENMTGSFQNGRTSSKMFGPGPAFNIVSLPEIACKIVRPFMPEFKERWQLSEFSVLSRKQDQIKEILVLVPKPESEDDKSRSRLAAQDWRQFLLGLVSKPESKRQEFSVSSR